MNYTGGILNPEVRHACPDSGDSAMTDETYDAQLRRLERQNARLERRMDRSAERIADSLERTVDGLDRAEGRRPRCRHREAVNVDLSLTGETVARFCPACSTQLPMPGWS